MTDHMKYALSGAAAGAVNGLFGGAAVWCWPRP